MNGKNGTRKQSLVIWSDAHASLDERSAEEIRGLHRPSLIHTYGYIVVSDEVGISIAGEWLPAENGGDETFRSVTHIPRGMVTQEGRKKRKPKSTPSGTSSLSSPSSRHSSPASSSVPSTSKSSTNEDA